MQLKLSKYGIALIDGGFDCGFITTLVCVKPASFEFEFVCRDMVLGCKH